MKKSFCFGLSLSAIAFCANAATVVNFTDVFGHNEKTNFGGTIEDMINGSGVNGNLETGGPRTGDPSTWTVAATSTTYQGEWQSGDQLAAQTPAEDFRPDGNAMIDGEAPTNSKIGWTIFDLGSTTAGLSELYIWHVFENTGRQATSYNILYASTPTVAPFTGNPGNASRDYDFSSGGWTTFGSGGAAGTTVGELETFNLGGISARYIGLEILSSGGDTTRVGFSEVAVTQIPEPSAALLGALGFLALLRRRR
jgi:hypothetical protein